MKPRENNACNTEKNPHKYNLLIGEKSAVFSSIAWQRGLSTKVLDVTEICKKAADFFVFTEVCCFYYSVAVECK